jgi:hypothetical protein
MKLAVTPFLLGAAMPFLLSLTTTFTFNSPKCLQHTQMRHCTPMQKQTKKLVYMLLLTLTLTAASILLLQTAIQTPNLPIHYLEVYKGWRIYTLEGYTTTYYVAQSPFNLRCEIYLELHELKVDVDTQENEYSIGVNKDG